MRSHGMLTPMEAETLALAGDNIAAAFDLGAGCAHQTFELNAVRSDGSQVGVRVLHGTESTVDALATSPLRCGNKPYRFEAKHFELDLYRYIDVRAVADATEVTLSRVTGVTR